MSIRLRRATACALLMVVGMLFNWRIALSAEAWNALETMPNLAANPDFELSALDGVPDGWYAGVWQQPPCEMYAVGITEENPRTGSRAGVVRSTGEVADEKVAAVQGRLTQRIDVTALRGHRLMFLAAARAEIPDLSGGEAFDFGGIGILEIGIERESDPGTVTLLWSQRVWEPTWYYNRYKVDTDDDVAAVHLGLKLVGNGAVYLDDVSLVDMGEMIKLAELARPLTDAGLENLIAFTHLLGYVRHFHPSDEGFFLDWDEFTVQNIETAEAAAGPEDLAARLEAMFRPVAPSLQVYPTGDAARAVAIDWWPEPIGEDWQVVSYKHTGCGRLSDQPSIYFSERIYRPAGDEGYTGTVLDPRGPFRADLAGGVSIIMPLALFADAEGALPRAQASPFDPMAGLLKYSGGDRASRLAGIALAWNVMQHFYPYFDVVHVDWPVELRSALISAATDPDELAYLYTLRRMMAALQDGHARVYFDRSQDKFQIPLVLGWADGQLVITAAGDEGAGGLQPGDRVLSVNGAPVDQAVAKAEETAAAATPQRRRLVVSRSLVQGAQGAQITLAVISTSDEERSATLLCEVPVGTLFDHHPPPICELEPGIYYLNVPRGAEATIEPFLPELEKAKGIIIDARINPGVGTDFLCHLNDQPMQSAIWKVPIYLEPDQRNFTECEDGGRWNLEPLSPRLTVKIACIIDASTQSYWECIVEFIEAYKLGELVGEATSGTNGNINPFILPGGYRVEWTGMIVLKNDGSQHHAVGILPTVPVERTIAGVAAGRDEYLEKALEIVRE